MIPEGMNFRAVRDIASPGDTAAYAYRAGHLVHESAVQGPAAWLRVGDDVEPVDGVKLDVPARNASQALWAAYMTSAGVLDSDTAQGMSRAALVEAYDNPGGQATGDPGSADAAGDAP